MSRNDIGLTAFTAVASALALLWISGGDLTSWTTAMLLVAVSYVVAERFMIHITETLTIGFSEMIAVLGVIVLPAEQAAAVFLAVAVLRIPLVSPSGAAPWLVELGTSGFYLGSIIAMLATAMALGPVFGSTSIVAVSALTIAVFAASQLSGVVMLGLILTLDERQAAKRESRAPVGQWAMCFGFMRDSMLPTAIQVPMTILGIFAWMTDPYTILILLAPVMVAWFVARQAQELKDAQRRAATDPLTGLANRAKFFERVELELASSARYGHGLALIMGDLDNFKRVNDVRGHLAGDHVLRVTATTMQDIVDESRNPLARYGGEEFVIAIPAASKGEVLEIAETIRAGIESALGEWGTSISLGVAYRQDHDRLESLIDRADKALYSAKFAGKNRVHEWPSENAEGPVAVNDIQDGDDISAVA